MRRYLIAVFISLFCFQSLVAGESFLGSRDCDPESLVQNVSTIYGDYSEIEIDLAVASPDPLVLSRFYSSRDTSQKVTFGGWRFYPYCYLKFQEHALIETLEGSVLVYKQCPDSTDSNGRILFRIDAAFKSDELYFDAKLDSFELILSSGGRRLYVKHPNLDFFVLDHETLQSGNKIFYKYDENGRLELIKQTNGSEQKVLAWIKIEYSKNVHAETSDGKTVDYYFEQQPSGESLLTKVIRSHKPTLNYEYQLIKERIFLTKKDLPDGRSLEIRYDENQHKVKSITIPVDTNNLAVTHFFYGDGFTEVAGPSHRKTTYRFSENFQLTAIEQYLNSAPYRIHRKVWNDCKDRPNLIAISMEDGNGQVYYYKSFAYDSNGNVVKESEYGNITGKSPHPLVFDKAGLPASDQEVRVKTYTYKSTKAGSIVEKRNSKGIGVRLVYAQGSHLLIKKLIIDEYQILKRYFYDYNDDQALMQVMVDDGDESDSESLSDVTHRFITSFEPKPDYPHLGAPTIIQQNYFDPITKHEGLLKKVVHHFDSFGAIDSYDIFDATDNYRYTIKQVQEQGVVISENDPLGNETHYSYDPNWNLLSEYHANTGLTVEYGYDLRNKLISVTEHDLHGKSFTATITYNSVGDKISERDSLGNETHYINDDLGRTISIIYPGGSVYTYTYDLFDNITTITDPMGNVTSTISNVYGQPVSVHYSDGTQESYEYEIEGELHRYCGRDGITKIFRYDSLGHICDLEYFPQESDGTTARFKKVYYEFDAFHLRSLKDRTKDNERQITYTYNPAGQLIGEEESSSKTEFSYDALGRQQSITSWKKPNISTKSFIEYDLLDHVIEERIEDGQGKLFLKKNYTYSQGNLYQEIGYPHDQPTILFQYDYDSFGRLRKRTNSLGESTDINYDDHYLNEEGDLVLRCIELDPIGSQTEVIFNRNYQPVSLKKRDQQGHLLVDTAFSYDKNGRRTAQHNAVLFNGNTINNYSTEIVYGAGDQLQSTLIKGDAADQRTTFSYGSYGSLTSKYPAGAQDPINYAYNLRGNLKSINYKEDSKDKSYSIFYDGRDNVKQIVLNSREIVSSYYDHTDMLLDESFENYKTTTLGYNREDQIILIRLPDSTSIEYSYEGPFVKTVSRIRGDKTFTHSIDSRDLMGHSLQETMMGKAGVCIRRWDLTGRLCELNTPGFQDHLFSYDPLGNIKIRKIQDKTVSYNYNALSQLVSEKGINDHDYSYDSLGNRRTKDGLSYEINTLNQITATPQATYTYDATGNIATKTVADKTFTFISNPLNQMTSIQMPDQTISFTYDLSGRRLSKSIKPKGQKERKLYYFYLGQTELGCINEDGVIIQLKIPGDPNRPETSPSVGIEIDDELFAPVYDLQNNIAALLDPATGKTIESYRYSAFGEEEIYDQAGEKMAKSAVRNPWRFQGKRVDNETKLIHFGYRYYDPEIGRWISQDPVGEVDGPNLYAYVRNNPLKYTDYFGLSSSIDPGCGCFRHGHPGVRYAPESCVCICMRSFGRGKYGKKGDTSNALGGLLLGGVKFGVSTLQGLVQQYGAQAMEDALEDLSLFEREVVREIVEEQWDHIEQTADDLIVDYFGFDPSSDQALAYQQGTYYTLIVADLLRPSLKSPKQALAFLKPTVGIATTTGVRGWKLGDSIKNLTRKGNVPSWSAVRARHWKNRAGWAKSNLNNYGAENIARMEKGLAPQRINPKTGRFESKDLHHHPAQKDGGLFDFVELWPDEHASVDPHRYVR